MISADIARKVDFFEIELAVSIAAPREAVFRALVGDITPWWGAPYLTSSDAKSLTVEPQVGGRFLEGWGDGQGALWGVVTSIKQDEWIEFTGSFGMSGAVHAVVRYELEPAPSGTALRLSHRAMGEVNARASQDNHSGWRDLLESRLKAWVERGVRSGLGHEHS
jgi:uncharacterized protein YndB with AHSA1/START domain